MRWHANSIKMAYPTHLVERVQYAGSCNAFTHIPVLLSEMYCFLPLTSGSTWRNFWMICALVRHQTCCQIDWGPLPRLTSHDVGHVSFDLIIHLSRKPGTEVWAGSHHHHHHQVSCIQLPNFVTSSAHLRFVLLATAHFPTYRSWAEVSASKKLDSSTSERMTMQVPLFYPNTLLIILNR